MKTLRIGVLFIVALCVAAETQAATIRGVVRAPAPSGKPSGPSNPYPGRAQSLHATPIVRGAVTDAVIYVDGSLPLSLAGASSADRRGGRLAQKGQNFLPRVLPVEVGARVDFPNMDPIYHNVFSVSPARRFDLGKYGSGKSKSVLFEKPGLVNVYCDIHSNMEAFILVLPHACFTQPEADGSFVLPPLAAGTYRIKVWHPDLGERSVTVTVGEREARSVEIAF